jgi:hypothetical protein
MYIVLPRLENGSDSCDQAIEPVSGATHLDLCESVPVDTECHRDSIPPSWPGQLEGVAVRERPLINEV